MSLFGCVDTNHYAVNNDEAHTSKLATTKLTTISRCMTQLTPSIIDVSTNLLVLC